MKKLLKPDIELLCEVMQNQCSSMDATGQMEFANWIVEKLDTFGFDFIFELDDVGNLYITKGKSDLYPCMVAHLDTVHNHVEDYIITQVGDFVMGFDNSFGEQVGCGADDRVGISLALEMFKLHDNIKLFFPVDEEIGAIGSSKCDISFFDDCCFMIQPDRNMYENKRDYVNFTNGSSVTTKEFDVAMSNIISKYGYTEGSGSFTDIGELYQRGANICSFNLSCYLNAHTDQETVWIPLYTDALNLINDTIVKLSYKKWKMPKYVSPYLYHTNRGSNYIDDPYDFGIDYLDIVDEEIQQCPFECEGIHVDFQIDDVMFCSKCQKTLGESFLINEQTQAWNDGWE